LLFLLILLLLLILYKDDEHKNYKIIIINRYKFKLINGRKIIIAINRNGNGWEVVSEW
jgi:hypothetical protein